MTTLTKAVSGISTWIVDRLPETRTLTEYLSRKTVPAHRHTVWYLFGGLALFFFSIQILTGILLMFYYKPTPDTAYESVRNIMQNVPFGSFIRSMHSWSANILILIVLVHMFSVFFLKSYRKPRELMWLTGVVLLLLMLGFGFTGYLLPWNTTAYFATEIGTEIPKSIPLVGEAIVSLLRGGPEVTGDSLTRLFNIHVIILPLTALLLVVCHVTLSLKYGSSIPRSIRRDVPGFRFFPDFFLMDLTAWFVGLIILVGLSSMSPWDLGVKANPFASAPAGIHPEWYFMALYQTLRTLPSEIAGINSEVLVNVAVGVMNLFWFAVPLIDTHADERTRMDWIKMIGAAVVIYLVVMTAAAYMHH